MRRSVTLLVVAVIGVLVALAVADALRSDGSSAPATALQVSTLPGTTAPPIFSAQETPEQEIERRGNGWASYFAALPGPQCLYMTQPFCERIGCTRVGGVKIENCTPPTRAVRKSFKDATVEEIVIKGNRAAARFSNGEVVRFWGDGGTWWVHKLGENAGRGFFE